MMGAPLRLLCRQRIQGHRPQHVFFEVLPTYNGNGFAAIIPKDRYWNFLAPCVFYCLG